MPQNILAPIILRRRTVDQIITNVTIRRIFRHLPSTPFASNACRPVMATHALPTYLTGDKAAINEFIDKFDVGLRRMEGYEG
jgi:hypothetical protein